MLPIFEPIYGQPVPRTVSEADFPVPDFAELRGLVYGAKHATVPEIIGRERLDIADLAVLLSAEATDFLPAMAARAAELTTRRFGRTIQIYAPLYLSSFCGNRCLYCGFSAE